MNSASQDKAPDPFAHLTPLFAKTDQQMPAEFQSLMRDGRAYSTSPVWRVSVSAAEAIIGIRSQWTLGISHVVLFTFLAIGLHSATRWLEMSGDVARFCTWGAWSCWLMAAAFMGGTLLFEKYRSRRAWFMFRASERTVSCPRLSKTFQIDEIHALQLLAGKVAWSDLEGRVVMAVTQLNLIVKENGQLQRYPLIGGTDPGRLSQHAELLSEYCGIRLLKDKAPAVTGR